MRLFTSVRAFKLDAAVQTPGHAVVNLAAIGAAVDPRVAPWVVAGAVLPDVPILVLYLDSRLRLRMPTERIWVERYPQPVWLGIIHGAHSLPLGAIGLAAALFFRSAPGAAFFASALLHAVLDFPIHGEDAHRHLFPFSHWRFISPLSYWDVRRHARVVAAIEACVAIAACGVLWARSETWVARAALAAVAVFYVASYGWNFLRRPARARA